MVRIRKQNLNQYDQKVNFSFKMPLNSCLLSISVGQCLFFKKEEWEISLLFPIEFYFF